MPCEFDGHTLLGGLNLSTMVLRIHSVQVFRLRLSREAENAKQNWSVPEGIVVSFLR